MAGTPTQKTFMERAMCEIHGPLPLVYIPSTNRFACLRFARTPAPNGDSEWRVTKGFMNAVVAGALLLKIAA